MNKREKPLEHMTYMCCRCGRWRRGVQTCSNDCGYCEKLGITTSERFFCAHFDQVWHPFRWYRDEGAKEVVIVYAPPKDFADEVLRIKYVDLQRDLTSLNVNRLIGWLNEVVLNEVVLNEVVLNEKTD